MLDGASLGRFDSASPTSRGRKMITAHFPIVIAGSGNNLDECWAAAHAKRSATNFHGDGPDQCGDMCAWMQNYTTARYHEALVDPFGAELISEVKEFAFRR